MKYGRSPVQSEMISRPPCTSGAGEISTGLRPLAQETRCVTSRNCSMIRVLYLPADVLATLSRNVGSRRQMRRGAVGFAFESH